MRKIITTTTDSIEGWTVKQYFDPITASIVLGANIFSDFRASLTDFFGGRSTSYERRLQMIYDQAIAALKKKAEILDANCIVGLRIDIDEINGKGTQMLMITAMGTPVNASPEGMEADRYSHTSLDGYLIQAKIKAKQLLNSNVSSPRLYTEENIDFVLETRFPELVKFVLNAIKYFSSQEAKIDLGAEKAEKMIENISEYFRVVDADLISFVLYDELRKEGVPVSYLEQVYIAAKKFRLLSDEQITGLIKGQNLDVAKFGLWLCASGKLSYTSGDINIIKEQIRVIQEEFKPVGETVVKKGLLVGKENAWKCVCEKVNSEDVQYCKNCLLDIYGFKPDELKPQEVIKLLEDRIAVINELLPAEFA